MAFIFSHAYFFRVERSNLFDMFQVANPRFPGSLLDIANFFLKINNFLVFFFYSERVSEPTHQVDGEQEAEVLALGGVFRAHRDGRRHLRFGNSNNLAGNFESIFDSCLQVEL